MAQKATARTEPRPALTRDRILEAALRMADEGGLESLSMRKLGQALGVEAMSLYNHVANKDDVIDGILDLVLAETEPPSPSEDWDVAIRASAISVHDALRRHRWAGSLLTSRARPARLTYMDSLLGRLREAGFSADATFTMYHVLDGHIFGFSLWENSHVYTAEQVAQMAELFERTITPEAYPHLREHAEQHFAEGPHREASSFEFALDLILDGLKKLQATS
jgi:AcrR family transcriptional regulator